MKENENVIVEDSEGVQFESETSDEVKEIVNEIIDWYPYDDLSTKDLKESLHEIYETFGVRGLRDLQMTARSVKTISEERERLHAELAYLSTVEALVKSGEVARVVIGNDGRLYVEECPRKEEEKESPRT